MPTRTPEPAVLHFHLTALAPRPLKAAASGKTCSLMIHCLIFCDSGPEMKGLAELALGWVGKGNGTWEGKGSVWWTSQVDL